MIPNRHATHPVSKPLLLASFLIVCWGFLFLFVVPVYAADFAVHYKLLNLRAEGPVVSGSVDLQVFNLTGETQEDVVVSLVQGTGVSLSDERLAVGAIEVGKAVGASAGITIAQDVFDQEQPLRWKVSVAGAESEIPGVSVE